MIRLSYDAPTAGMRIQSEELDLNFIVKDGDLSLAPVDTNIREFTNEVSAGEYEETPDNHELIQGILKAIRPN